MEHDLHNILNKIIKCYDSWHGRLSHVDFSAIEKKKTHLNLTCEERELDY